MIKLKGSLTFKEAIKKKTQRNYQNERRKGSKFRDSTFFVKILEVQA